MKKILYILLFFQSAFLMAQTETFVTVNGKKVTFNPYASGSGGVPMTANNGLTASNGNVQLGGLLTKPSVLTTSSAFTLAIKGLQSGDVTDQFLTTDADGIVRKISNYNWSLRGNAGTIPGLNFVGTIDDQDLVFKRNNFVIARFAYWNLSIGQDALSKVTTGKSNVAFGTSALLQNTSGKANVAVGEGALIRNSVGSDNTALGSSAMFENLGSNNTAAGSGALGNLKVGDDNVAIGCNSGFSISYIGPQKPNALTKSSSSVFIGSRAIAPTDDSVNQIIIGYGALGRGSNTVQIGNDAITSIGGQVAWSNPSDVRLKKDIVSSTHGLDFVSKLRPVTYHMKTGTTDLQSGFIAQEVESAAKAVNYEFSGIVKPANDSDFYSLRYSEFVVPLVKAVQEQQQMIESQKADIAELKAQVQALINAAK